MTTTLLHRSPRARMIATLVSVAFAAAFLTALVPTSHVRAAEGDGLDSSVRTNLGKTGVGTGLATEDTAQGGGNLVTIVGKVIGAFLGLIGVILVVLIIYAGYLWMTAGGNEEQVSKAKDIIKNAVIGMIILFLAYSIAQFVVDALLTTAQSEGT